MGPKALLGKAQPELPRCRLRPVGVNRVLVDELHPPAGEEQIERLLLPKLPIDDLDNVRPVIQSCCFSNSSAE